MGEHSSRDWSAIPFQQEGLHLLNKERPQQGCFLGSRKPMKIRVEDE